MTLEWISEDRLRLQIIWMAWKWACHEQHPFLRHRNGHGTNNTYFYCPQIGMSRITPVSSTFYSPIMGMSGTSSMFYSPNMGMSRTSLIFDEQTVGMSRTMPMLVWHEHVHDTINADLFMARNFARHKQCVFDGPTNSMSRKYECLC